MGKKRPPPLPKPKEFQHTPFSALKGVQIEKPAPPKPPPPKPRTIEEIDRSFEEEMAGVAPLVPDPRGRLGAPEPPATTRPRRLSDDAEAYAQLADLVEGA